ILTCESGRIAMESLDRRGDLYGTLLCQRRVSVKHQESDAPGDRREPANRRHELSENLQRRLTDEQGRKGNVDPDFDLVVTRSQRHLLLRIDNRDGDVTFAFRKQRDIRDRHFPNLAAALVVEDEAAPGADV